MAKEHKRVGLRHPVYRTAFQITEEWYDSPQANTPVLSHTLRGQYRIDVFRALCVGTALCSALAVVGLLAKQKK